MKKVNIVLVEWNGYPISRKKKFGDKYLNCGVEPLLQGMANYDGGLDFDVHLMVNSSPSKWFYKYSPRSKHHREPQERYLQLRDQYDFVKSVTFRGNEGMDIGAYNQAYESFKQEGYSGDLVFMNSSVRAPDRSGWLSEYQGILQAHDGMGICGISLNSHNTNAKPPVFLPHVQSFLLYTTMDVMKDVFPEGFPTGEGTVDKLSLIEQGEIGISTRVLEKGYGIACRAFPDFMYHSGGEWLIPEGDIRSLPEFENVANQL